LEAVIVARKETTVKGKNEKHKKPAKPTKPKRARVKPSLSSAIGLALVRAGRPKPKPTPKPTNLSFAIGAALARARLAAKKAAIKKRPRRAPVKIISRKLTALQIEERDLQRKIKEVQRKRRLYRQGLSKSEIATKTKRFLRDRLETARRRADSMTRALTKSSAALAAYSPTIHVHVNDDGSVDGELSMLADDDYIKQFRELALNLPRMRGAWILLEIYYAPEMEDFYDESDFLIRRGLVGVPIHSGLSMPTESQWEKPQGITKILTARLIAERIEEGSGFRPTQIVVRVYWSPTGERPI
jgi:hypothetical protein